MLQDTLRSDVMASVPFFDHQAVLKFLNGLPRMAERSPHHLAGVSNRLVYLASVCVLQGGGSIWPPDRSDLTRD